MGESLVPPIKGGGSASGRGVDLPSGEGATAEEGLLYSRFSLSKENAFLGLLILPYDSES